MKKEKVIVNLCCVAACLVEWAVIITALVALRMKFNYAAGIVLFLAWIVTCRVIKAAVHKYFQRDKSN